MPATKGQYGITNYRINREPIDAETVFLTYQDIKDRLETNESGNGTTLGAFYGGLITSVTSDTNIAYNGPWYISYSVSKKDNKDWVTYSATRIPLTNDIEAIKTDLANNYVSHKQLKETGECVNAAYVDSLGKEANLNIILSSLLTPAQYTKPSYTFNFKDGKNGTIYSKNAVIEVGSTINLCFTLNLSYYNTDKKNIKGVSYGFNYFSFNYDPNGENTQFTLDRLGQDSENGVSYTVNYDLEGKTYNFNREGSHTIANNIILSYLKASYQGFPQLLENEIYVPSKKNWFDNGNFSLGDYNIIAKYKYYYGWDADISSTSFTPKSGTGIYLPIINSTSTTTTSPIAFTSDHTSFWFAIPSDVVENEKTSGFNVLYHTSIGDADLVSTSATVTTETKKIRVGTLEHNYLVTKVNFNRTISGGSSNYVKFTMKKK